MGFVIYGHRGASAYRPENTLSAFELAIEQGADGLETDIQLTKDGKAVLFHDDTMERVTDMSGRICDYTLVELKEAVVFSNNRDYTDCIMTLEDFLARFGGLDLTLALELKSRDAEEIVLTAVERYRLKDKVIITSFDYCSLVEMRELDEDIRIGYLVREWSEAVQERLAEIDAYQVGLAAENLSAETVIAANAAGYNVRAWGVYNEALMEKVVQCGADGGMTVDFPDAAKRLNL